MININKFNTLDDFLTSGNVTYDECRVSQIGPSAGMNIIYTQPDQLTSNKAVPANRLSQDEVALVVLDNQDNKVKFIPQDCFQLSSLDTTRYTLSNFIRYRGEGRKQLMVYKTNNGGGSWGRRCYYRLYVDTTVAGTLTWSTAYNGQTVSGTCNWSAGANLSTIASAFTATAITSGNVPSVSHNASDQDASGAGICAYNKSGENFIRISIGSYSNTNLTASGTGLTNLEDLSKKLRYNGSVPSDYTTETHHSWQGQTLQSMLPASVVYELRSVYGESNIYTSECRCLHGDNTSYTTAANLARAVTYSSTNGTGNSSTAFGQNYGMKRADFNSWTAGVAEYGTYENYMAQRMMDINSTLGVNALSKNNGHEVSVILAAIETADFTFTDGSTNSEWVGAFPAASASLVTDPVFGSNTGGLPSAHEMGCFMCDKSPDRFGTINKAIGKLSGGAVLSNSEYYWSAVEYNSYTAWSYYGVNGTLSNNRKYSSFTVRPALAYSVS